MENTERFYHRFWFTWLLLTALYTGQRLGLGYDSLNAPTAVLGLFVPFGPLNTLVVFLNLVGEGVGGDNLLLLLGSIAALGLFIFCLTHADRWLRSLHLSTVPRILGNIIILGVLTLCVDLLLMREWASLKIALGTFNWMEAGY